MEVSTTTSILELFSTIISSCIEWMTEMLSFFTSNPVILIPMLLFFIVGGVIGLVLRVLRS